MLNLCWFGDYVFIDVDIFLMDLYVLYVKFEDICFGLYGVLVYLMEFVVFGSCGDVMVYVCDVVLLLLVFVGWFIGMVCLGLLKE